MDGHMLLIIALIVYALCITDELCVMWQENISNLISVNQ